MSSSAGHIGGIASFSTPPKQSMSSLHPTGGANRTPTRPGKGVQSKRSYISLDHLTNFSLPPRQQPNTPAPRRRKKPISQQVWNKESGWFIGCNYNDCYFSATSLTEFVNAQYRFVMKPTEDYTVHFADPDMFVVVLAFELVPRTDTSSRFPSFFQWQDILQVIIPPSIGESLDLVSEATSCPICLTSPPVAPRVTKCGHIFCFPCILHYLQLGSTPKWNRCPICFDSVNESHLKCVRWGAPLSAAENPSGVPGSIVKMRLMERPHITTMALPRSATWPSDLIPPHQAPFHFLPDVGTFAKFMLATPEYLVENLTQELDQLEQESKVLETFQDELGLSFVRAAKEKVAHQIEKASALESTALSAAIRNARKVMSEQEKKIAEREERRSSRRADVDNPGEVPDALLALQSAGASSSSIALRPSSNPTRGPKARKNVNPTPPPSSYFYYQAANGAPLFLHPLDTRILLGHFESFADLPDVIEFTTTETSYVTSTINDEVRKRYKYLSHLPEGADVVFLEAGFDLGAIVGADGLKPFEGALKLRQGKKREKERKEERARIKAEERERDAAFRAIASSARPLDRIGERSPSPSPLPTSPQHHTVDQNSGDTNSNTPTGAWGNRSFAATIRNAPTPRQQPRRPQNRERDRDREDEDWEMEIDAAWLELENAARSGRNGSGGRKKAGKKLLVLSSGRVRS
ncbi:hypothetical protein FRB99_002300 [Tulasnella sp. 403]|nr:hypothetical protein FRB99_002300 [Tulasnella sp. 403]